MSKHGVLPVLWPSWSRHASPMWKVEFRCALACEGPRVFLHHELIVYIITHFLVSVRSTAAKQAGRPSNPLFPGVKSCHLRTCHFLSLCLVPLTGPFCLGRWNMCHLPPLARVAVWIDGTRSRGRWWSLTGSLHHSAWKREGRWPLINTIFTRRAEKDRADSISETLPFTVSLSHATVNNRKTERGINFCLFLFVFFNKEWLFPVSQADEDGWQHHRNTATKSDNYQATSFWWQRMLVLWLHAVITAPNQESRRFHATFHPWLTRKPCGECTELTATPC